MSIFVTTARTVPTDARDLIKEHIRVTNTASDSLLSSLYIPTAIDAFEKITGRSVFEQTVKQVFDCFPGEHEHFLLERGTPLTQDSGGPKLFTINYWDEDESLVSFDSSKYEVVEDSIPTLVRLKDDQEWPSDIHSTRLRSVEVNYTAGYENSEWSTLLSNEPQLILVLSQMVADLFNFRENQLYSPGGTIVELLHMNHRQMIAPYMTGFYEWRSQSRLS